MGPVAVEDPYMRNGKSGTSIVEHLRPPVRVAAMGPCKTQKERETAGSE